jgi:thiamine biosynthesis lipoprotein ApbE
MKRVTPVLFSLAALLCLALPLSTSASAPEKAEKAKVEKAAAPVEAPSGRHQYGSQIPLTTGIAAQATVVASSSEAGRAQAALAAAFSRAQAFDQEFFTEGGVEAKLASLPQGQALALSPDGFEFFKRAVSLATLTGGWFDITGPSGKSFFTKKDWRRLSLDDRARTIALRSSGMAFDLRRAAAGYEADLLLDELSKQGFTDAMVQVGDVHRNIGKDIFTPWNITLEFGAGSDTESARRALRYDIQNIAAATVNPQGMGSKLTDPLNKKVVDALGMRSITVFAADAMTATAFALAAYTIGPKFGLQFIEAHPETRGIMVDRGGNMLASRGLTIVAASHEQSEEQRAAAAVGGSNDLRQKEREEALEQ